MDSPTGCCDLSETKTVKLALSRRCTNGFNAHVGGARSAVMGSTFLQLSKAFVFERSQHHCVEPSYELWAGGLRPSHRVPRLRSQRAGRLGERGQPCCMKVYGNRGAIIGPPRRSCRATICCISSLCTSRP